MPDGRFVVSWSGSDGIRGQVLEADGSKSGNEIHFQADSYLPSYQFLSSYRFALTTLAGGKFARNAAVTYTTQAGETLVGAQIKPALAGLGYDGSINMSRDDARRLGAAIGCDFFITGKRDAFTRSEAKQESHETLETVYRQLFEVCAR